MESTESGSLDESKNLETEDIVAKYDEDPEALSSQNEEDQGGEPVYGYLYRSAGSEDATIYVDSRGFNLNGQSLIVTQNDDGNEIIVLVEDPDGQPLDQSFAHTVLQPDQVSFEDGLKEHGTLVVDEHSQGLEFIKSSEEEHEERHVYIENSGEILNISNENVGSPVDIESPLWSVSNSGHLKNDGTEMLFIPNPTVVLAPEETKHRKLMQLACIAHELQSADQKSNSTGMSDYVKDSEASVSEYENSVKVTQSDEDRNFTEEETDDKCLPNNETEECIDINGKSAGTTSIQVVDNTVSVIHSTSSEVQGENQAKLGSPPDFSSGKNFSNSESELPSEMLYSNVTFQDNLGGSPSSKQLEECSKEENSQSSMIKVTDERCPAENDNLELHNSDSPLIFIEKSHKLHDNLNIENCIDDSPDMKMDDDSQANSSVLVIEDENPKSHDSDSSLSLMECSSLSKKIDISERTSLEEDVPIETGSRLIASDIDDDNISSTEHSMSVSENESSFLSGKYNTFNYKEKAIKPSSENNLILSPALQDDKSKQENGQLDLNELGMKELKIDESKISENIKNDAIDFEQSPSENLHSDLVIAETIEDREINVMDEIESTKEDSLLIEDFKSKSAADVSYTKELVSPDTTSDIPDPKCKSSILSDSVLKESNADIIADKVNWNSSLGRNVEDSEDIPDPSKLSDSEPKESNADVIVKLNFNSSPGRNAEEYSDSEGPSIKPTKKTYIRLAKDDDSSNEDSLSIEYPSVKRVSRTYISKKKMKKNTLENKTNICSEKIELFAGDDINFNECDNVVEARLNSPKDSCSSHENNTEPDDNLVSDIQSKVSAARTYSVQKEKCLYKKKKSVSSKQGLRSHSLRARSSSSSLLLKNGSNEVCPKKNFFDSSNSDNIPWGKVLLETSFEPCTLPSDTPSTSFASQYPKETSTPLLSPEQRRRKINKYKRDFDRLLNSSSPVVTKQPKIGKRHSSRMHPNVIKATKSKYSSSHSSKSSSLPLNTGLTKRGPRKKMQKPKEAKIHYLSKGTSQCTQPDHSASKKQEMYACSSCNFSSMYVDNLIEHLKYCSNRQPVLDYEVNNMDKRQRIRGEEDLTNTVNNALKKIRSDLRSALMDDDPSLSFPGEEEKDSDGVRKRKKYGYGDDDVVWVKFQDRYWPALVFGMDCKAAYVKLINYPTEVKGLKVNHEHIQTFDNSKWNLMCLAEAESLPHNEIFVKAVQSCERFMSKKFLGVQVTGKEFFSVRDEVDFATDNACSGDIINEDSDSELELTCSEPARKARYEKLDSQKIYEHIIEGKADDYVLDIYYKRRQSKKHLIFFEKDNSALKSKPWFGPLEDIQKQENIFSHFREMFLKKIGKKGFFVPYICQVWIPEAIVQALSVVKDIPLKDAELLFESEDSLDLENEDPSIEEILKKYS